MLSRTGKQLRLRQSNGRRRQRIPRSATWGLLAEQRPLEQRSAPLPVERRAQPKGPQLAAEQGPERCLRQKGKKSNSEPKPDSNSRWKRASNSLLQSRLSRIGVRPPRSLEPRTLNCKFGVRVARPRILDGCALSGLHSLR